MAASRSFVVTALLAIMLSGCGAGYVRHARKDYSDGRYLEVAEGLGQHEGEINELAPKKQVEYGMYRGLSLLMLGDLAGAHQWMSFAYEVERQSPGSMKPEQRAELDRGWARLAAALAGPQVVPPGAIVVPAPALTGRPAQVPAPQPQPAPAATTTDL